MIRKHPDTQEPVFFSSLFAHRPWFSAQMKPLYDAIGEDYISSNVYWEDMSPISMDLMAELYDIMQNCSQKIAWQEGDFLLLNNYSYSHARQPYTGERKLFVSFSNIIHDN